MRLAIECNYIPTPDDEIRARGYMAEFRRSGIPSYLAYRRAYRQLAQDVLGPAGAIVESVEVIGDDDD